MYLCSFFSRLVKPKSKRGGDAFCKLLLNILAIWFGLGGVRLSFFPGVKQSESDPLMFGREVWEASLWRRRRLFLKLKVINQLHYAKNCFYGVTYDHSWKSIPHTLNLVFLPHRFAKPPSSAAYGMNQRRYPERALCLCTSQTLLLSIYCVRLTTERIKDWCWSLRVQR